MGSPALTSRGLNERDFDEVADFICIGGGGEGSEGGRGEVGEWQVLKDFGAYGFIAQPTQQILFGVI